MRRLWPALLASLALHALLLVVWRVAPRPRAPADIDVEIVERELPPVPLPPPPAPAPAPGPAARRPPHRTRPAPAPVPAPPPVTVPEGGLPGAGEARAPELATPLHAPPAGRPAPPPPSKKERLEEKLDGLWDDARAGVAAQNYDDYYYGVKEELARGFKPPADMVKSGPSAGPSLLSRMIKGYLAQAEAWGRTGSPDGRLSEAESRRAQLDELAGRSDRLSAWSQHSAYEHVTVVIVELRQDSTGAIVDARVADSSGSPGYDRFALEHVRGLDLSVLGPPTGGRRTRWAFQSIVSTVPPMPYVGCSFDAYFVPQECYWPLKETLRSRVSLVAIYADRQAARNAGDPASGRPP